MLYSVWGILLAGALVTWLYAKYKGRYIKKFQNYPGIEELPPNKLRRIHKFEDPGARSLALAGCVCMFG